MQSITFKALLGLDPKYQHSFPITPGVEWILNNMESNGIIWRGICSFYYPKYPYLMSLNLIEGMISLRKSFDDSSVWKRIVEPSVVNRIFPMMNVAFALQFTGIVIRVWSRNQKLDEILIPPGHMVHVIHVFDPVKKCWELKCILEHRPLVESRVVTL